MATVHLSVPSAVLSHTTAEGEQVLRRGRYMIELSSKRRGDAADLVGLLDVAGEDASVFSLDAIRKGSPQPV